MLIRADNLAKHYPIMGGLFGTRVAGAVRAVDGVSFTIDRGETLALVGESGCGKSTTGRLLTRLIEPTAGTVRFDNMEISEMGDAQLRAARRRMQLVFQDAGSSFNPRMTVSALIAEPMHLAGASGAECRERVLELLPLVGLAAEHADRYPHEFSGGQRQRIGIARALALEPSLIVCDEPVSALDVSIQAQVVNLFQELQERLGLTYLFIAHDLAVVRHISHRIAVMYLGRIVEIAPRGALYSEPLHPYTQALLAAIPIPDPEIEATRPQQIITGEVPSAMRPPSGCRFHTRCPRVMEVCRSLDPPLREQVGGRSVACHLYDTE